MDGLTTNGVLIMQPESGFNLKCEPRSWKEASVCGNMFSLRSSRSAPKSGEKVSRSLQLFGLITSIYAKLRVTKSLNGASWGARFLFHEDVGCLIVYVQIVQLFLVAGEQLYIYLCPSVSGHYSASAGARKLKFGTMYH